MKVPSLLPLLILVPALLPPPLLFLHHVPSYELAPSGRVTTAHLAFTWWNPGGWLATLLTAQTDVAPDWTAWERGLESRLGGLRWQPFWQGSSSSPTLHGPPADPESVHHMDFSAQRCKHQGRLCVFPAYWTTCVHVRTLMNSDTIWTSAPICPLTPPLPYRLVCSASTTRAAHDSTLLEHINQTPGLRINHGLLAFHKRLISQLWFTSKRSAKGHWRFFFEEPHHKWTFRNTPVAIVSSRWCLDVACCEAQACILSGSMWTVCGQSTHQPVMKHSLSGLVSAWMEITKDFNQHQLGA